MICSDNIKIIRVNAKLGHWTPETRFDSPQNLIPEFSTKVSVNLRVRPRNFLFLILKFIIVKAKLGHSTITY